MVLQPEFWSCFLWHESCSGQLSHFDQQRPEKSHTAYYFCVIGLNNVVWIFMREECPASLTQTDTVPDTAGGQVNVNTVLLSLLRNKENRGKTAGEQVTLECCFV